MKHPKPEEWIPYFYDECSPEEAASMKAHLEECAECSSKLEKWRTVGDDLKKWKPNSPRVEPGRTLAGWKWAAAAALLISVGFGLGRGTSRREMNLAVEKAVEARCELVQAKAAPNNLSNMVSGLVLAELEKQEPVRIKQQFEREKEITSQFAGLLQRTREEDQKEVLAMISEISTKGSTEYISLRKDLETLAATADEEIRFSKQRLLQLTYK
jgi:hypothetical protein